MKRTVAKVGDRVRHEYLGTGTVVDVPIKSVLAMVQYDVTSHVRYNMGENPTVSLLYDLEVLHDLSE